MDRNKQLINNDYTYTKTGVQNFNFNDSDWKELIIPSKASLSNIVWLRKKFDLAYQTDINYATITIGKFIGLYKIFINGELIADYNWYGSKDTFHFPTDILKKHNNIIAIRMLNAWTDEIKIDQNVEPQLTIDKKELRLDGSWRYSQNIEPAEFERVNSPWRLPSVLYNAMINPIIGYSIKGFLWYQGEANSDKPKFYNALFESLIKEWRIRWRQGNIPFIYVQLASYKVQNSNKQNKWAELREAQSQAQDLPNTGMASAIDIGDADDIHPRNKKDVGKRLWLVAKAVAYGDEIVFSGPQFHKIKINQDSLTISFQNAENGLKVKGAKLLGFEISKDGKVYQSVPATIKANSVNIRLPRTWKPNSIRYGWADYSVGNLYNNSDLPAIPFKVILNK